MGTSRTATLSPVDVTIVISQSGFTHIIGGFAEDSNIMVERGSDNYDLYVGIDNQASRIYKADKTAKITVNLAQTSVSNDILDQLQRNDANARNSSQLFSVIVKDGSGRSVYHAQEAWVSKTPSSQFGSGMNTREWILQTANMDSFIGGNAPVSAEDVSSLEAIGGTVSADWRA